MAEGRDPLTRFFGRKDAFRRWGVGAERLGKEGFSPISGACFRWSPGKGQLRTMPGKRSLIRGAVPQNGRPGRLKKKGFPEITGNDFTAFPERREAPFSAPQDDSERALPEAA